MKQKLIPVLIFAMAMALIGLVAVQAFWMREAFKMKADEFDRSVSEALKSTNYALEAREASRLFANSLDQKQLVRQIDSLAGPVIYTYDDVESIVSAKETRTKSRKNSPKSSNSLPIASFPDLTQQQRAHDDSLISARNKVYPTLIAQPTRVVGSRNPQMEASYHEEMPKKRPEGRQLFHITIDLDSIMDLWVDSLNFNLSTGDPFYFEMTGFPLPTSSGKSDLLFMNQGDNERVKSKQLTVPPATAFVEKPRKAEKTPQFTEQVVQKKLRIDSLLNKVAFDYISPKQPIEQRISEHEFDSMLRSNLQQHGITIDFQFQVVREQKDIVQRIYGDSLPSLTNYEARLFPNDMFNLNERLLVHFPHPTSFLLGNLLGMLLVSFALILVLFVVFFVTISVLLRQKKLSDMKSDFINNMTHEFKTPLATINLAADALANPKVQFDAELTTKYLGIIKTENKRMNTHVEQVLQTAQLERQELTLHLQRLDLRYLLEHALDLMEMQYENRQAKLSLICGHEDCFIDCDESHMLNVFTNLLDNALKYAKANPDVVITGAIIGQKAVIRIKDNGIGMNRETRQRIFEKFYRLPTGNVHNIKGFGLGLSYVKAIVEAHKGSISVDSELEIGSTFTITLPLSSN